MMVQTVAQQISNYLTTGMHHSTNEGQKKILEIIAEHRIRESKAEQLRQKALDSISQYVKFLENVS